MAQVVDISYLTIDGLGCHVFEYYLMWAIVSASVIVFGPGESGLFAYNGIASPSVQFPVVVPLLNTG